MNDGNRNADASGSHQAAAPTVRVALGWRARDVERESTAPIRFSDQDEGAALLEGTPATLAYADPEHAFTLPAGKFVAVDEVAGRVARVTVTPQLAAFAPADAIQAGAALTRTLKAAGWTGVAGEGLGIDGAVAQATHAASNLAGGFGVAHVGTWHVPRSAAPWAALPRNGPSRQREWDGVEALITVRPVRSAPGEPRLIYQVQLSDPLLELALQTQLQARRNRYGGDMQTLRSWDAQPSEPLRQEPGIR